MPPRWCLCGGPGPMESAVRVDVLMDRREQWRPSSTGKLIERVVIGARRHVFLKNVPPDRDAIVDVGRALWILHPAGEPLAHVPVPWPDPARLQVLLLDGSWGESGRMLKAVEGWGRVVCLPLLGRSRYWLRDQQGAERWSTVEALLALYAALGLQESERQLRLRFELLVYATLRVRGRLGPAAEYLEGSPLPAALPEYLAELQRRRPNPE